jgi:hypothetical protein
LGAKDQGVYFCNTDAAEDDEEEAWHPGRIRDVRPFVRCLLPGPGAGGGRGARSQALSLRPEHDQVLDRAAGAGTHDPVGIAGVELGDIPGTQHEVLVAECEPQPPVQDAQPFPAVVGDLPGPRWWLLDGGQDTLVGVQAPDVPGQRQHRLVVAETLERGGAGLDGGRGAGGRTTLERERTLSLFAEVSGVL